MMKICALNDLRILCAYIGLSHRLCLLSLDAPGPTCVPVGASMLTQVSIGGLALTIPC